MMTMTIFRDWRELPFPEIWSVDTEYYPGPGKANGGRDGDIITPLCLVAYEMRSGRIIRRWQDELGPFPPYRLDPNALFVSYLLPAEFGFHIACGWGEPACALDAYVEFRHCVNDGSLKAADRDKGFYSLGGYSGSAFHRGRARSHPAILRRRYCPRFGASGHPHRADNPLATARTVSQ
jgi:hypothetical protein